MILSLVALTARFLNYQTPGQDMDLPEVAPHKAPVREVHPLGRSLPRLEAEAGLRLVAAYVAGTPISELATQFDIDITTVHSHLKRQGIELRPFRKLKPEHVAQANELRAGGASVNTIAKQFGVSWNTVQRALSDQASP